MDGCSSKTPKNFRNKPVLCFRKRKDHSKQSQFRGLVCLQVHQIKDLPMSMEGKALAVGWRTKGWEGEQTLPVHVSEGVATLDEIFLHYCKISTCVLNSFSIWVALVEARESDLGTFSMDFGDLEPILGGSHGSKYSGRTVSFDLCGKATGGRLTVSFYCTIMESESLESQVIIRQPSIRNKKSGNRCFPCLPDLKKHTAARALTGSNRRVSSLDTDLNFITIETSSTDHNRKFNEEEEKEEGFITMERGLVRARSWRPPSDNSVTSEDLDNNDKDTSCEYFAETEANAVEDEFLKMLEERHIGKSDSEFSCKKEDEKAIVNLKLGFEWDSELEIDLESILMAAEMELVKATRVWKNRVGARELEKAEYEELVKKWGPSAESPTSLLKWAGFGSPI